MFVRSCVCVRVYGVLCYVCLLVCKRGCHRSLCVWCFSLRCVRSKSTGPASDIAWTPVDTVATTQFSFTGKQFLDVDLGSQSIPADATHVLADVFVTANADHQTITFADSALSENTEWVGRGAQPSTSFAHDYAGYNNHVSLVWAGDSDGFASNYGACGYAESVLVPHAPARRCPQPRSHTSPPMR